MTLIPTFFLVVQFISLSTGGITAVAIPQYGTKNQCETHASEYMEDSHVVKAKCTPTDAPEQDDTLEKGLRG